MLGMKDDMTGAATVLAVTVAVAKLRLPVRLTAWLCIAENMPSGTAIRPDDVLTIKGGTTVEVTNTDAEGRLVMADGLVAASDEQPDAIVDVATLTGAQVVALGMRYVGVMGNDDLASEIVSLADTTGETFWRMPLAAELRARLNSDVADLVNATPGNTAAGMLLAGVFLNEFVGSREGTSTPIPWAHLDIAGPSNNKGGGYGYTAKGSTGVTVRTLIELADKFSAA
jgi:leucyl aminopeptidase